MNPRDFELIALSHILSKYRISGELPSIDGKPFNLNEFKTKLFAGVPNYDPDININIDTVKMENTVVDCDDNNHNSEEHKTENTPAAEIKPDTETDTNTNTADISSEKTSIGGKLFQFFAKDNEK